MNKKVFDPQSSPKYDTLLALAGQFDVPAMLLLDLPALRSIFSNLDQVLDEADQIISRAVQTLGSFLSDDWQELSTIVEKLRLADRAETILGAHLAPVFGPQWQGTEFAIRSSGTAEDLDTHSFAGIYHTELSVVGANALLAAIARVWRSAFTRNALVERVAAGELRHGNPLCVIVQVQINPDWAGVAFSCDPLTGSNDCVVEAVSSLGERLVSGAEAGTRAVFKGGADDDLAEHLLWPVANLCRAVADHVGRPADIEWAMSESRVWLLQVRPITTLSYAQESSREPRLTWEGLYADGPGPQNALEPIPEFARYFRAKRKRIYDFSKRAGLARPVAIIARANANGLADGFKAEQFAAQFQSRQVIIDLNDRIRQRIIPSDFLRQELTGLMPDPNRLYTFVVRDFVRGDMGLITEPLGGEEQGSILIEWTPDGLLAMNRGTAVTSSAVIGAKGAAGAMPPMPPDMLEQLRTVTLLAQAELGPMRIEWVADHNRLYAIDFSQISSASRAFEHADVIAHGFTEAPVVALDVDETLVALSNAPSMSLTDIPDAGSLGRSVADILFRLQAHSVPPIVVIDRPYAILAALLPYVSGFVFERASSLCHLSILLRERGLPAMQVMTDFDAAHAAGALRIDTRGKGVTVLDSFG